MDAFEDALQTLSHLILTISLRSRYYDSHFSYENLRFGEIGLRNNSWYMSELGFLPLTQAPTNWQ